MDDYAAADVVCGIDVGKSFHHAFAVVRATGEVLCDKRVKQSERDLGALFDMLKGHGSVLVVIDQLYNIGALTRAVALDRGCLVAYLPGFRMRSAADFYGSQSKTDAADARVIARAAADSPDKLKPISGTQTLDCEMRAIISFDDDIKKECTAEQNRIRAKLSEIHPPLERVFAGQKLKSECALALLGEFGGPYGFKAAGKKKVLRFALEHSYKTSFAERLVDGVFEALGEQTVEVPGSVMQEQIISHHARQISAYLKQRKNALSVLEDLLELYPGSDCLMTVPGVDTLLCAKMMVGIGGIERFDSPAKLASYAGFAPVRRESGTSIRSSHQAYRASKMLKDAMFRSAFVAANTDPQSHEYYEKKRSQGKHHNAAVAALARCRVNVIYSVLANRRPYVCIEP